MLTEGIKHLWFFTDNLMLMKKTAEFKTNALIVSCDYNKFEGYKIDK